MAYTKEIKHLDKSNVELTVTIPKDDLGAKYREIIKEYLKNVQLPGFRKGKVPQSVLEIKFGDKLKTEILQEIINKTVTEILSDENLPKNERLINCSTPQVQGEPKLDLNADLIFSVIYDVMPEVNIKNRKGLKVEYPYAEITDSDIARELETVRERNAIVRDIDEDTPAKKGDIAAFDFEFFDTGGKPVENYSRRDFSFTIGPENDYYQFSDIITGMKTGETKETEKTYSNDIENTFLAGKTFKIKITLNSLKEKQLPDLDDDLAQDVDEKFKTLDDLKNSIKEKLDINLQKRLLDVKTSAIMKEIMKETPVVIPQSMINLETANRFSRVARVYGTTPDVLMGNMLAGLKTEEEREERVNEWRKAAEESLHPQLIIEKLIEEQNYEVTDEDIENEIKKIAAENNVDIEEIRKNYSEQPSADYLKENIKRQRVINTLLEENTLEKGKKENYLDFMSDN